MSVVDSRSKGDYQRFIGGRRSPVEFLQVAVDFSPHFYVQGKLSHCIDFSLS